MLAMQFVRTKQKRCQGAVGLQMLGQAQLLWYANPSCKEASISGSRRLAWMKMPNDAANTGTEVGTVCQCCSKLTVGMSDARCILLTAVLAALLLLVLPLVVALLLLLLVVLLIARCMLPLTLLVALLELLPPWPAAAATLL
jgi:hypothetical protein